MRKLIAVIATAAVLTLGLTVGASARVGENQDTDGVSVISTTTTAPAAEAKVEVKEGNQSGLDVNDQQGLDEGPGETGNHDGEHENAD